jgi:hypothetical protein
LTAFIAVSGHHGALEGLATVFKRIPAFDDCDDVLISCSLYLGCEVGASDVFLFGWLLSIFLLELRVYALRTVKEAACLIKHRLFDDSSIS